MAHNCFFQGCELEVQYVCRCLSSVTYCCEFHIESHLKLPNIAHSFDFVLTGPSELTKDVILKFLEKEKSKKEKLKKTVLTISSQNWNNTENSIKSSLNYLNSDLEEISCLIEKISQISDKNPLNSLTSQNDISISEAIVPNTSEEFARVIQFCELGQLWNKKSEILNKTNNDNKIEEDFRRTCSLYENYAFNSLLSQAYQEYISGYHKIASTYLISKKAHLYIYNTETEKEKDFTMPESFKYYSPLAKLPNGELFFIGLKRSSHSAFILDKNYRLRKLPRGVPSGCLWAICLNRSVYCLGENISDSSKSSRKFDLGENRWIDLARLKKDIKGYFNNAVFNRNILISVDNYNKILLYSIDIDSFSEIPYIFAAKEYKFLINAGERLYLIESRGWVYESDVGDEYNWTQIAKSIIEKCQDKVYCCYNKGGIYISILDDKSRNYFKFDLNQKVFIEIAFYSKNLSLQRSGDDFEKINYYDNTFELNPKNTTLYINSGDTLYNCGEGLMRHNNTIKREVSALVKRATILCDLGVYLEAIECCNQVFNENPNYADACFSKGKALQKLERYIEAIECFNKAIEYKLKYVNAYFKKEKKYTINNIMRTKEAIEYHDKAIKLKSDIADVYNSKGEALYNLDRNEEALESYNEAIKINADKAIFYLNRANTFNKLGREMEASQSFDKANDLMKNKQTKE